MVTREPDLSRLCPSQGEHVVDQLRELAELLQLALQHSPVILLGACSDQRDFSLSPQRGQRSAEFMGNAGGEILHLPHGLFQTAEHVVEGVA